MVKLLLCDDHSAFREGLVTLLSQCDKISIAGQFSQGEEVLAHLKSDGMSDVLLLDVNMPPGINGFELARILQLEYPALNIIMLSAFCEPEFVLPFLTYGIKGYVSKCAGVNVIADAIFSVMEGYLFNNNTTWSNVESLVRGAKSKRSKLQLLTAREFEVAKMMTSDMAYKQIAAKLTISPNTVDNIRTRIFEKTGSRTRTEVAMYIMKLGLWT